MVDKDIRDLRVQIGHHQMYVSEYTRQYLRACGWEYTCKTPGSRWMWVRRVPAVLGAVLDQVAFYDLQDALCLQDSITAELHPLDMTTQAAIVNS